MKQTICFLLALVLFGCKDHNPVSSQSGLPPINQQAIDGKWHEEFVWYAPPFIGITQPSVFKASTLTLQNNKFEVSILPPQLELIPHNTFLTPSPDTLYLGTFILSQDTISFFIDGQSSSTRFLFHAKADSVSFSALPLISSDSLRHYFLWANSITKTEGVFKRIN